MTSTTPITLFTLNANPGRVAKNILRLRELATITSKQEVIVPEQKLRALLSYEGFMQPGQTTNWLANVNRLPLRENKWFLASFLKQGTCSQGDRRV